MRPYGPLRGREHELSTALAVIRRTRTHGASGVVLISGTPESERPRCYLKFVVRLRT